MMNNQALSELRARLQSPDETQHFNIPPLNSSVPQSRKDDEILAFKKALVDFDRSVSQYGVLREAGLKQMKYLEECKSMKLQTIDILNIMQLEDEFKQELQELHSCFGDDVRQCATEILKNYAEVYKFSITNIDDQLDFIAITIVFIIDNVLKIDNPLHVNICKFTGKVLDVTTNIYAKNAKLRKWLVKHDHQLPPLLQRLQKTLYKLNSH